jgi:hypothetical protein
MDKLAAWESNGQGRFLLALSYEIYATALAPTDFFEPA